MKFFLYFLCWISCFGAVHSALVSSAYEALFFYYAYQIDAAAKAAATEAKVDWTKTVGNGCKEGGCTFGTFVKSILPAGDAATLTPTSSGDTTTPEIYDTAQDIISNWNYNAKSLVFKKIISGSAITWKDIIIAVVDKIQAAQAITPQATLVEKAKTALRYAQAARLTDMIGDVTADPLSGQKTLNFKSEFPDFTLKSIERELATDTTGSESRSITYTDLDYDGMTSDETEMEMFKAWAQKTPPKAGSYRSHRGLALLYGEKGTLLETGCST
ncbi:hypothetical protein N7466_009616 [Penicillium verhagenii]|uniref:uncharacterized protein n=1 Tax=Penicillium verhagenii TaxID=1562060 RepID=UPI0025455DAB|nr:uncharacterized protein N7466_009616 [Penicillium verhagenii]KAJ5921290.1 hypothetical protein N7466_009616 [Penicillium verhagenii]